MNRWLAGRYQAYALRDTDYLVRMMKEIASENGTLDVCYDGGSMIGMESRWGWDKKEERLLYAEEPYICESAEAKPAVMARIISAEAFVGAACLAASVKSEKMMLKLRLTDPLIAENDGVWNWHLTHETSWLERVEQTEEAQISLTVTELTEWLFGYGIPEKAEPYRDMIQALDGVFLDEIV